MTQCPICNSTINLPLALNDGIYRVCCQICGEFEVSESIHTRREGLRPDIRHVYSGALRENFLRGKTFYLDDMSFLISSVRLPDSPVDKIDKLLLAVESKSEFFGQDVQIDCNVDFPFAYALHSDEFFRLLRNAVSSGYLDAPASVAFPTTTVSLNIAGARRLAELHKFDVNSDQAFVAMSFANEMDSAYTRGIAPALESTGYKALIIKNKEHDNKIDDEIFAEINKSGLLIADFTGHRPSVYYEAGYARGLGIRVIYCCREDQIGDAHFDTRQYSHVTWKEPEDLEQKLIRRIQAGRPTEAGGN